MPVFFVDASGNMEADTHAIGIVICLHGKKVWATASAVLPFQTTTLDAEMVAICRAVLLADRLGISDICVRSDCKAAVSQFQGSPPRRSSGMELWRRAARSARSRGRGFRIECINRHENLAHSVAYQQMCGRRITK